MWLFGKKPDLPGFRRDKEGKLVFDLTEEEQKEVESIFRMFHGYRFNPIYADKIQKGTTAFGLSNYAIAQARMSGVEPEKEKRQKLLKKAIAAITKAYSIYQLPIYLYDFACLTEMTQKADLAKNMFKDFLNKQLEFKPNKVDKLLLNQRDIDEAIKDAKAKAI